MRARQNDSSDGVSLIEVVVAISIMAILAGIITPLVSQYINESRVVRAQADVNPRATKVIVRSPILGTAMTYDLRSALTENILVRTGDDIEFTQS